MNYQCIEQYKQEFSIVVVYRVLDVRGKWLVCLAKASLSVNANEKMPNSISEIRQEYSAHQGRYGSPRLHAKLRDRGRSVARKRIARLMREAGLYAKRQRRRVFTTRRDPSHPVAPNLLHREFTASAPNKKWVTDITSIPTMQGWLYVAVILDLYSRMVVGWSMEGELRRETGRTCA
ncbi:MAG: IS3 family transposase [Ktedonobacteraceae bacterium]